MQLSCLSVRANAKRSERSATKEQTRSKTSGVCAERDMLEVSREIRNVIVRKQKLGEDILAGKRGLRVGNRGSDFIKMITLLGLGVRLLFELD